MRRWVVVAFLAVPGLASADGLVAPRPRQGYYVAFGAHGQLSYTREEGDGLGPWAGFAGGLRLGQLVTERLGLGFYVDGGGAGSGGESTSVISLGLGGEVEIACNLALTASVGYGIVTLSGPDDDPDDGLRGVVGGAYSLGLAYDWFVSERRSGGFALTPSIQLRTVPGDTDAYAGYLGLSVTWWTGLPRNQLDLDVSEAYRP